VNPSSKADRRKPPRFEAWRDFLASFCESNGSQPGLTMPRANRHRLSFSLISLEGLRSRTKVAAPHVPGRLRRIGPKTDPPCVLASEGILVRAALRSKHGRTSVSEFRRSNGFVALGKHTRDASIARSSPTPVGQARHNRQLATAHHPLDSRPHEARRRHRQNLILLLSHVDLVPIDSLSLVMLRTGDSVCS